MYSHIINPSGIHIYTSQVFLLMSRKLNVMMILIQVNTHTLNCILDQSLWKPIISRKGEFPAEVTKMCVNDKAVLI